MTDSIPNRTSCFWMLLPLIVGMLVSVQLASADESDDTKSDPPPATRATTRPLQLSTEKQIDIARRRAMLEVAAQLMTDAPPEHYRQLGRAMMGARQYEEAIVFDLLALKLKPDDAMVEYDLAMAFAGWKKPLAMKYFAAAVKHGYWGYPTVSKDTDLNPIKKEPGFDALLLQVKQNYDREAANHPPGVTVKTPEGDPPKSGWPAIVFLHGWGSHRGDYEPVAEMAAKEGYLAIAVDSANVMSPESFEFADGDVEVAHAYVVKTLKAQKAKIDPARVLVAGFSQGAENAACLLAAHPEFYAGAIANSPGGKPEIPETLKGKSPRPLYLMLGSHESPITGACVGKLEALWKGSDWPTETLHFEGRHQFPPESLDAYRTAIEWVTDHAAKKD